MLPIAQGTDFGCSIRIPAAFCGIVGLRPTPGLMPSYPMALAWDPGQLHGPLARDAEDAALMLDALRRLHPHLADFGSAAVAKRAGRTRTQRGHKGPADRLCLRHRRHRGRSGNRHDLPRGGASALSKLGAQVEEIKFSVGDGRAPYQTWRGFWMVGQQYERLDQIEQFGPNLKGNVEAGLKLNAHRLRRSGANAPAGFPAFPATVRALRYSVDAGGAGEALSGRAEFPRPHQRPQL